MRELIPCWLLLVALGVAGCASKGGDDAALAENESTADGATLSASGQKARRMLPNTDNGLEVRKWVITPQQGEQLLAALAQATRGVPGATDQNDRLERNGFRFVRVKANEVDELIADVGGAAADVSEWHGQAPDWRPLQQRPIGRTPRALAIDGRVRRFDRGSISLMIRSWTVQMETGPMVYLEAVPRHDKPQATHLRELLREKVQPAGESFGTMGLDVLLEPGYAYVLLGESPQTPWPGSDEQSREARAADQPTRKSQLGPFSDDEPELAAPQSLGEFQLTSDRPPPMRTVFVFVPKFASPVAPEGAMTRAKADHES